MTPLSHSATGESSQFEILHISNCLYQYSACVSHNPRKYPQWVNVSNKRRILQFVSVGDACRYHGPSDSLWTWGISLVTGFGLNACADCAENISYHHPVIRITVSLSLVLPSLHVSNTDSLTGSQTRCKWLRMWRLVLSAELETCLLASWRCAEGSGAASSIKAASVRAERVRGLFSVSWPGRTAHLWIHTTHGAQPWAR